MTIKSSPIAHQPDDHFELSNSSFLVLSSSNEDHTVMLPEDLEITEQPKSFMEEYGQRVSSHNPQRAQLDCTESQCNRFFKDLEAVINRKKRY